MGVSIDRKAVARGLGWFGIGLGVAELVAPGSLARLAGLQGYEKTLRLFGAREIASGIPLVLADEPTPWLWGRVAGDALDAGLLGTGLASGDPSRRKRALIATLAVAPVVALDLLLAAKGRQHRGAPGFVRYSDEVEVTAKDEPATVAQIIQSLERLHTRNLDKFGRPVRVSHAKAHGVAAGELIVADDLPDELRQGLFANPARYPVIVRLANVPGEIDSDIVATQRGLAFKVLGVDGTMLPGHEGERSQDFVLDTGNRFAAANAKQFLQNHLLLEHMPQVPDAVKGVVSAASLHANQALHGISGDSAMLDFFGHPRIHPLAEAYFTQAPVRYGEHIAKLAVVPAAPAQVALKDGKVDPVTDPDVLRTATVDYLREHDAVFEVRVQLCTDLAHAGRGREHRMARGREPVSNRRPAGHSAAGRVQPRAPGLCRRGALLQPRARSRCAPAARFDHARAARGLSAYGAGTAGSERNLDRRAALDRRDARVTGSDR